MFTHKRNFDCTLCGTVLLAREIGSYVLLKCGCGEQITEHASFALFVKLDEPIPTDFVKWTMTWVDDEPCSSIAWVEAGKHPTDTKLWGLLNYPDMMADGNDVTYKGVDILGQPVE